MSKQPSPPGGYEEAVKGMVYDDPVRIALTTVTDAADLVTRWLVDHGIDPKPMAVVRLTELALQRADKRR